MTPEEDRKIEANLKLLAERNTPYTWRDQIAADKVLAKLLAHDILKPLIALENRVKELEAAPLQYDGPHEAGKVYGKGMFVTHDGSLWHCNYKTASRPGDGPAWTLAVKRGKDAR